MSKQGDKKTELLSSEGAITATFGRANQYRGLLQVVGCLRKWAFRAASRIDRRRLTLQRNRAPTKRPPAATNRSRVWQSLADVCFDPPCGVMADIFPRLRSAKTRHRGTADPNRSSVTPQRRSGWATSRQASNNGPGVEIVQAGQTFQHDARSGRGGATDPVGAEQVAVDPVGDESVREAGTAGQIGVAQSFAAR
jgi:hypothetical protein